MTGPTVKQILAKEKLEEQEKAAEAKLAAKRRSEYEACELSKATETVLDALEGFSATLHENNNITVYIGQRRVSISIRYETRKVRYDDECRPEMKRCLEIGIGYRMSERKVGTYVEGFAKAFAQFLKTERLV